MPAAAAEVEPLRRRLFPGGLVVVGASGTSGTGAGTGEGSGCEAVDSSTTAAAAAVVLDTFGFRLAGREDRDCQ